MGDIREAMDGQPAYSSEGHSGEFALKCYRGGKTLENFEQRSNMCDLHSLRISLATVLQ